MPLPALGELPQLTALSLAWRRLIDVKPMLMVVNNTSLVCCWDQGGDWHQRIVAWPDGVCRDGVPLQREAVGELIADLIFDSDCPGAELVLGLPLRAASWCVVDGYGSDGSPGLVPQALQSVALPFDLAESYVTSLPVQESFALVGVPRALIQGWSEVAEAKICIAEIGPIQAGSAEIGPSQISCVEVCIAQVRTYQLGVGQRAVRARSCVETHDQIVRSVGERGSEQHC